MSLPVIRPVSTGRNLIVDRMPRPVAQASSIDSVFTSPTIRPLQSGSFSDLPITYMMPQSMGSSLYDTSASAVNAHSHSHGHVDTNVATASASTGDTTVHKTEVVETVVETQKNEAAVATQDTAQTSAAASQSVASGTVDTVLGDLGLGHVETAAAASSSQAASSSASATAAKEEKVVTKTKKTTTTVVKAADPTVPLGVNTGDVQQVKQVVEETIQQGSSSSVASASDTAAVSAESSAASSFSGIVSNIPGGIVDSSSAASASSSNVSSASSAAESNSTSTVKKVTKKTTTITQTKASDTGGHAGMNSELPKNALLNLEANQAVAKKPPTAILSNTDSKKSVIDTKAVLIATDKPKLAAPLMIDIRTDSPTTTRTTTEEVEIEAEGATTTTTTPNLATGDPAPNPGSNNIVNDINPNNVEIVQGRIGSTNNNGPNVPYSTGNGQPGNSAGSAGVSPWKHNLVTDPPLGPHDRMNTTDVPEEIEARPDKTLAERKLILKRLNPTWTNAQINAQIARDDRARAEHAAALANPNAKPSGYVPIPSHANGASPNVAGWAGGPTTEPALGSNDRINTTDVPEEIEARPDLTRAQRRQLLRRMNPGSTAQQIEEQLIRDDKARAAMAATQNEPVVMLPEPVTPPTIPPPLTPPTKAPVTPALTQSPAKSAQSNQNGRTQPQNNNNQQNQQNQNQDFEPIVKSKQGNGKTGKSSRQKQRRRKQKSQRRPPTTTPEPATPPTTYSPTFPTTDYYFPTTYPTYPTYPPTPRMPSRRQQNRGQPQQWGQGQQNQQQGQQWQPQRRRQNQLQGSQWQPQRQQNQQGNQWQPQRQQGNQWQAGPQYHQQEQQWNQPRPKPRPRLGRRRKQSSRTSDVEEYIPRDPFLRWLQNNVDGETLETLLLFNAIG